MAETRTNNGDCEIELIARIRMPFGKGPGWKTSVRFNSKDEGSIRSAVEDAFGSMRKTVDKNLLMGDRS